MNGTSAFMSRMAYITPSASPPQLRMITTRTPMPAPKIQQPFDVIGEVTMSVAMYTAPRTRPPENSMNGAEPYRSASARCNAAANTATVARMETGMRQLR